MKYHKILKAEKALKRNKIFRIGIILSGIFSLAFGVVTFYGQDSGNFMMSIDRDAYTRGIVLSTTEAFDNPQARLMTDPVDEARDLTYRWLKIDEVKIMMAIIKIRTLIMLHIPFIYKIMVQRQLMYLIILRFQKFQIIWMMQLEF